MLNQKLSKVGQTREMLLLKVFLLDSGFVEDALRLVSTFNAVWADVVGSLVILFGMRGWWMLSEMKQGGELVNVGVSAPEVAGRRASV